MSKTTALPPKAPTAQDIIDAAERIAPYVHTTPVLTSTLFDELHDGSYFFKGEHLQMTGAFKARGAMNAILQNLNHALTYGVVTHSSGNHGAALSWAAQQIGAEAHIIMPSNAPKTKIAAVQRYGGNITFCEPTLEARESTAAATAARTGALLIHPYNNYHIIAGQATATYELLQSVPDLKHLFIPVGGGGLLAGAALANHFFGRAKIYGCEPANASDAHESFTSGTLVPVKNPNTIADGLRTSLGDKNFPIIQQLVNEIVLVSEEEIESAWHTTLETTKQMIEPSAATGVAVAIKKDCKGKCGIMLCGGNMDVRNFKLR